LDSSNDFPQSFKRGLAVGYAFSVTSVIVIYISYCAPWEQSKHGRNKHRKKAKELSTIFWSIAGRKTPTPQAPAEQELQPLQLQEKVIKEVLSVPYHIYLWIKFRLFSRYIHNKINIQSINM